MMTHFNFKIEVFTGVNINDIEEICMLKQKTYVTKQIFLNIALNVNDQQKNELISKQQSLIIILNVSNKNEGHFNTTVL